MNKFILRYTANNGEFWGVCTVCANSLVEALEKLYSKRPETRHNTAISFNQVSTKR